MFYKLQTPSPLSRRDVFVAISIGALTLALRLVFLFHSPDMTWPHSFMYEGDAPVWVRWAAQFAQGQPFEYDIALRTPGVAWLLYIVGFTAAPFTTAKVLWCVLSAATTASLYVVLARWFTRSAALLAATLCAISYGSFVLSTSLNNETPYALLLVIIAGATLSWIDRPRSTMSLTLGILNAAAMLLRAEHALLLALLMLFGTYNSWRATPMRIIAVQSALLLLTALSLCAPWTLRSRAAMHAFNTEAPNIFFATAQPPWTPAAISQLNKLPAFARAGNYAYMCELNKRSGMMVVDDTDVRAFFEREWGFMPEPLDEWALISMKGPLDFALANHPNADGGFSRAGLADSHDSNALFSLARPSHSRLVKHGYQIGFDFIRNDPARWLTLVGEKLSRLRDGATLGLFANDWPHKPKHIRRAVDIATPIRNDEPLWNFAVLASLIGGGVIACLRRGGMVWICIVIYKLIVTIAFYGYARQAVSIAPALFALTALGVDGITTIFTHKRSGAISYVLAGLTLSLLFMTAAYQAWYPPLFTPRAAQVTDQMNAAPQWGAGAFESVDKVILEPKAR